MQQTRHSRNESEPKIESLLFQLNDETTSEVKIDLKKYESIFFEPRSPKRGEQELNSKNSSTVELLSNWKNSLDHATSRVLKERLLCPQKHPNR